MPRWRLSIFFGHLVSYAREQIGYSLSFSPTPLPLPLLPPQPQHPPTQTHTPKILYVSLLQHRTRLLADGDRRPTKE